MPGSTSPKNLAGTSNPISNLQLTCLLPCKEFVDNLPVEVRTAFDGGPFLRYLGKGPAELGQTLL